MPVFSVFYEISQKKKLLVFAPFCNLLLLVLTAPASDLGSWTEVLHDPTLTFDLSLILHKRHFDAVFKVIVNLVHWTHALQICQCSLVVTASN